MPQATPSPLKRRGGPARHVPYNANPKAIGTRTGRAMPTNVPRGSDGFEDGNAFFDSPADGAPSTARTARTRRDFDTPGASAFITPSNPGKKGRLSQLMGSDDEEDGSQLGRGLLDDDEEEVLAPHLSSPNLPYFSGSNPPNVSLPRRTRRTPTASPSKGFDNLPTPKARNPRSSTMPAASPGTPGTGLRRKSNPLMSPPMDSASFDLGGDMGDFGGDMDMDVDDELADRAIGQSISPAGRKKGRSSLRTEVDAEDAEEVEQNVVDGGDGASDGSDGVGGHGFELANGDDDEGLSMEEAAIAAENEAGSGEEELDEEEQRPVKRKNQKRSKSKEPTRRRERTPHEVREKRRLRVSRMGVDEESYKGDFTCRRSGRRHFQPLKYWLGERFEYQRGQFQPAITEVVHIPDEPSESFAAKRKRAGRSRSAKSGGRGSTEETAGRWGLEDGWDEETEPVGVVQDFITDKEIQRRIALPRHRLEPKLVTGSNFKYQKVFGEDLFIAAGVVYIPVGGQKPSKHSKDNAYIFFVLAGAVQVTIHRNSFVVAPGGMFMVPRGNHYQIENISQHTEAELFFSQSRKIQVSETDQAAIERIEAERATSQDQGRETVDGAGDESTMDTPKARKKKRTKA